MCLGRFDLEQLTCCNVGFHWIAEADSEYTFLKRVSLPRVHPNRSLCCICLRWHPWAFVGSSRPRTTMVRNLERCWRTAIRRPSQPRRFPLLFRTQSVSAAHCPWPLASSLAEKGTSLLLAFLKRPIAGENKDTGTAMENKLSHADAPAGVFISPPFTHWCRRESETHGTRQENSWPWNSQGGLVVRVVADRNVCGKIKGLLARSLASQHRSAPRRVIRSDGILLPP